MYASAKFWTLICYTLENMIAKLHVVQVFKTPLFKLYILGNSYTSAIVTVAIT